MRPDTAHARGTRECYRWKITNGESALKQVQRSDFVPEADHGIARLGFDSIASRSPGSAGASLVRASKASRLDAFAAQQTFRNSTVPSRPVWGLASLPASTPRRQAARNRGGTMLWSQIEVSMRPGSYCDLHRATRVANGDVALEALPRHLVQWSVPGGSGSERVRHLPSAESRSSAGSHGMHGLGLLPA